MVPILQGAIVVAINKTMFGAYISLCSHLGVFTANLLMLQPQKHGSDSGSAALQQCRKKAGTLRLNVLDVQALQKTEMVALSVMFTHLSLHPSNPAFCLDFCFLCSRREQPYQEGSPRLGRLLALHFSQRLQE